MNTTLRRAATAVLAAGALALLSACGGTSVLSLEVGQCVTDTAQEGQVSSVPVVECSEPHTGEIYALPQLPDGEFPGEQVVTDQGTQLCTGQPFQDYVGVPYQQSEIYYTKLVPSTETWSDGDREIVCILANQDGSPLTPGSLRGVGR